MSSRTVHVVGVLALGLFCCALVCAYAPAAHAQQGPWPMPEVVLEVHPNERAPGTGTPKIGDPNWVRPPGMAATYWWHDYVFAASGVLWIQVCAQNWAMYQTGFADDDDMRISINGIIPGDYDGIQNGLPNPGGFQWDGQSEKGQRWTLRFLYAGPAGVQVLSVAADEEPILWWVKVTDLEEQVIYP